MSLRFALHRFHEKLKGRPFASAFAHLSKSQHLSREAQQAAQQEALLKILEHAATQVPYYRRCFEKLGFSPSDVKRDPELFRRLPILTRDDFEGQTETFIAEGIGRNKLGRYSTSGTSGKRFYFYKDAERMAYAHADMLRHDTWSGFAPGTPRGFLYWDEPGPLLRRIQNAAEAYAQNSFFIPKGKLERQSLAPFVERIIERKPKVIHGYPTALRQLAIHLREHGRKIPSIRGIYSAGEPLYPTARRFLEETFGGTVYNRYASVEMAGIGCECNEKNGFHLSTETNLIEVVDEQGRPCPPGVEGDIVGTALVGPGFPLIRYAIGDRGRLDTTQCKCGRASWRLEGVHRQKDGLLHPDNGRRVKLDLDDLLLGIPGLRHFQGEQVSKSELVLRLEMDAAFRDKIQKNKIVTHIHQKMGSDVRVRFELEDEIPFLSNGKFKHWIGLQKK